MRFIQSTNPENVIVNLDNVIFIQKDNSGIIFGALPGDIIWELTPEQLEEDWKNILSHLNNDINQKQIF